MPATFSLTNPCWFAIVTKRLEDTSFYQFLLDGHRLSEKTRLVHSANLPPRQTGELLHVPREKAHWEWMSFFVHRLQPGEALRTHTENEEAAFVILGGTCLADWGQGEASMGKRKDVFDGLPYTVYLPAQNQISFYRGIDLRDCRVPCSFHGPAGAQADHATRCGQQPSGRGQCFAPDRGRDSSVRSRPTN